MTNEEAINSLKDRYETVSMCLTSDECKMRNKALDIAIKCIDKQIPKKPIEENGNVKVFCPTCKGSLSGHEYCGGCGQAISWSYDVDIEYQAYQDEMGGIAEIVESEV